MSLRHAPLLLILPLLAAACGSSAKNTATTTTSTAPLSQQQFVKAGNQVCIRSDQRIFKLGRLTRSPVGWAKTAAAARVGIKEMQAVKPPASAATTFNRMLDYGQQLVQAIQNVHDNLAKKKFTAAISAQFSAARLQDHVHAEAKLAGLTFCQQNLTNWPG